jgi:sugar/nucleoside kinase (ribokinase family)
MAGGAEIDVSGSDVEVVSTMGAGDAFFGTLAAGLAAAEWDVAGSRQLLVEAAAEAARACTHWGALS